MLTLSSTFAELLVSENPLKFGAFIEGAGVDPAGNFYATHGNNITSQIAGLNGETFQLENTTLKFNGIKFVSDKVFYAVEMIENKIYKYDGTKFDVFCEHPDGPNGMSNDLVLHGSAIYISGNKYNSEGTDKDGQVWMCDMAGQATVLDTMGRTNGIAINPEGTFLYVTEAYNKAFVPITNKIWKYPITSAQTTGNQLKKRAYSGKCSKPKPEPITPSPPAEESQILAPPAGESEIPIGGTPVPLPSVVSGIDVAGKTLVYEYTDMAEFTQVDLDGMRFDVEGNLYCTRNGGSSISVFDKSDKLVDTITTTLSKITNLEIINKVIYTTVACTEEYGVGSGCVETFPAKAEGDIYTKLKAGAYESFV